MQAYINEIEVELTESEQQTLKKAHDEMGRIYPESFNGHQQPREIKAWREILGDVLDKNNSTEKERVEMLEIFVQVREIDKQINEIER